MTAAGPLLLLGLLWALLSDDDAAAAPSARERDPLAPPPPGPLPGVPAELQRPLEPMGQTSIVPPSPAPPWGEPIVTVTEAPAPPDSTTRQTRLSVQPDELPDSPELRHLSITVRSEGRRLARLAAVAVRAETSRPRQALGPVRDFQGYIAPMAGAVDGKWGRTTARVARLFAGPTMPGAVW